MQADNVFHYQVAGLTFSLQLSENDQLNDMLTNYKPFLTKSSEKDLFHLTVYPEQMEPMDLTNYVETISFDEETQHFCLYKSADKTEIIIVMTLAYASDFISYLRIQHDYSAGSLLIRGKKSLRHYSMNNALMMMFAFAGAKHNMLLQHASVIKYKDKGYLFLGKSGTGKSTHSSLWLKYIEGCTLLNDDNPIIGLKDGIPMVYGSPWSGKTPCYKNEEAEIGGFVRLWQAPKNKIRPLNVLQAYAALLPTVSGMKWERGMADDMNKTLNDLITKVPVLNLECLPDEEAARMSFHALTGE